MRNGTFLLREDELLTGTWLLRGINTSLPAFTVHSLVHTSLSGKGAVTPQKWQTTVKPKQPECWWIMPNKVSGIILLISLGLGLTTKRAYVMKNMSIKETSSKEQQKRVKKIIPVPRWMFKKYVLSSSFCLLDNDYLSLLIICKYKYNAAITYACM